MQLMLLRGPLIVDIELTIIDGSLGSDPIESSGLEFLPSQKEGNSPRKKEEEEEEIEFCYDLSSRKKPCNQKGDLGVDSKAFGHLFVKQKRPEHRNTSAGLSLDADADHGTTGSS